MRSRSKRARPTWTVSGHGRGRGLIALQAPINSGLGKAIGTFAAAAISFAVGLACCWRSPW